MRRSDLPVGVERSGNAIVREGHRRTNKDVVFYRDPVVDGDVVLNLAAIADGGLRVDVNVLTENAAAANRRSVTNVAMVPHGRSRADVCTRLDNGGFMNAN